MRLERKHHKSYNCGCQWPNTASWCDIWGQNGWRVVVIRFPDSKVHVAHMGPIWGRQDPMKLCYLGCHDLQIHDLNIKMSYQQADSHYKDKIVSGLSYLYSGNSHTQKDRLYIAHKTKGVITYPYLRNSTSDRKTSQTYHSIITCITHIYSYVMIISRRCAQPDDVSNLILLRLNQSMFKKRKSCFQSSVYTPTNSLSQIQCDGSSKPISN